jgi:hypothetical protein
MFNIRNSVLTEIDISVFEEKLFVFMPRITSHTPSPLPPQKKNSVVLFTSCRLNSKHFFPMNLPLEAARQYWRTFRAMSNSAA